MLAVMTSVAFSAAVLEPSVSSAAGTPAQAVTAPPSDPAAVGPLTLCSKAGTQVTTGSLSATPVTLWRVVDSTPAPAGYTTKGTATLFAFQPRPEVSSGDWSGQQLTGSSTFSEVTHPMVASTQADTPLSNFIEDYPILTSAHVVQLRVILGAPDAPPLTATYDASYLSVSGSTWTQLAPGPDVCGSSGTAVSDESLLLPQSQLTPEARPSSQATPGQGATPNTGGSPATGSSSTAPAVSNGGSADASPDPGGPTSTSAALASSSSSTSDVSRNVIIGACVLLLAAFGGLWAVRRRS